MRKVERPWMTERIKIEPVSGFPEWLPGPRLAEDRFLAIIRQQYQLYGFASIETPAIERLEVLTSKGGMQRQIYTVGKPEEGKSDVDVGLHFDLTVPLARYVVQYADKLVFPFRRYQIQKVWRGERAQRGRFREFYQCDVDVVGRGSLNIIHDAEIPCVINGVFEALSVPEFQVQISNRKILGDLLNVKEVGPEPLVGTLRAIDKTGRAGIDKTREVLGKEGVAAHLIPAILDLIQCADLSGARAILAGAGAATDGLDELQTVIDNAVALGMPASRLRPNFAIARGLDYYTGTIYETFIVGKEDWGSICSGGRYDDLAGFFTTQTYPGVGISIGLTRLFNLLVQNKLVDVSRQTPTQVLVTVQNRDAYLREYLALAALLRGQGIATEVYLEPAALRDQIGYASSKGIPLAVIAGESEITSATVAVRDLRTRSQEVVPREKLAAYVTAKMSQ
jgi:histidyl-tRNA synthetase